MKGNPKKCARCKQELSRSAFGKCSTTPDGLAYSCRECRNRGDRAERRADPEKFREKNRAYYEKNAGSLREKTRIRHAENRDRRNATYRKNYDPLKGFSRQALKAAVNSGCVTRPNKCQSCGAAGKTGAHHKDYLKPLDVMWLCHTCHQRLHGRERTRRALLDIEVYAETEEGGG